MADYRTRRKQGNQVKDTRKPLQAHLTDFRIDRSRSQVQKGGMKRDGKPGTGKPVGRIAKIGPLKSLEVEMVERDLRVDTLADHHGQQLLPEKGEWYMDLDFFQYVVHAGLTVGTYCAPFTTGGHFSQPAMMMNS